jgi:hypothetical protein
MSLKILTRLFLLSFSYIAHLYQVFGDALYILLEFLWLFCRIFISFNLYNFKPILPKIIESVQNIPLHKPKQ